MATTKNPISTDSDATLRDLIGDDASATFESDPNFIDSDAGASGSSNHVTLRDTDDTADSEEEEDEAFEDDDGEDEEDEEDDEEDEEDEDEDEEDDGEEIGSDVLQMAEPINVHGPGKHDRADIEEELEEMEEEDGVEDEEEDESVEEIEEDDDDPRVDRAIDKALRMSALVAVGSGFADYVRGVA
jgi:hypothetical protein